MSFSVFVLDAIFCGAFFFHFSGQCDLLRNLDVINVVPFINSTGLAIVAEADLRCGDFLSEKNCCYKLVVSFSFWSWLLNNFSVLTSLKYTPTFFELLMRCGFADKSWEY